MFPAFGAYAARPFASIVQVYGILNPKTVSCPCNPKDICNDSCGCSGEGNGNGTIKSSIDISFVQYAIKSILNIKDLDTAQLLDIIQKIVQKQLTYADYSSILDTVSVDTILNDPYFFFIFYSYSIVDYQYVQLQLKIQYYNLEQQYINMMKEHEELYGTHYTINNVGLNVNTSIKMDIA